MYETLKGEKWKVNRGLAFIKNVPSETTSTNAPRVWESGEKHFQLEIPGLATAIYKCPGGHGPSMLVCVVGETIYHLGISCSKL